MNTQNRNRLIDAEHFDSCQMAKAWGMMKEMKGLKTTNWQLQNSPGDVKDSIGNIVSNIVVTMYGVRWVLDLLGGPLFKLCLITLLYT